MQKLFAAAKYENLPLLIILIFIYFIIFSFNIKHDSS